MRVVGHYFVVVFPDPGTISVLEESYYDRYIYQQWNGKVGECVSSTFRNGAYWFLLRFEDRFECFHHRHVRLAPNEMQEMAEDLRRLIEFTERLTLNDPE